MLKKHQIMEQAVEDYAETVHQLSKTSRGLVADGHPERCVHSSPVTRQVQFSHEQNFVAVCVSVNGSVCGSPRWISCTLA